MRNKSQQGAKDRFLLTFCRSDESGGMFQVNSGGQDYPGIGLLLQKTSLLNFITQKDDLDTSKI
jgi:hypothetical protein